MKLIDTGESRSWIPNGHASVRCQDIVSEEHGALHVAVHMSTIGPGGGSDVARHANSEQVFVMLAGELTFLDGEQNNVVAGPGTAVYVPANDPHGTLNRGTCDAVCIVITAPPAE